MQHQHSNGQGQSPTIAQAKIILLALIAGIAVFSVAAAILGPGMALDDAGDGESFVPASFRYVAIAVCVTSAGAAFFVRNFLASRVGKRRDEALAEIKNGKIPTELMAATITGAAVAEGGGMLGAVGMLLTGDYLYLVMPAVAVAVMLVFIPTETSLENLAHE